MNKPTTEKVQEQWVKEVNDINRTQFLVDKEKDKALKTLAAKVHMQMLANSKLQIDM